MRTAMNVTPNARDEFVEVDRPVLVVVQLVEDRVQRLRRGILAQIMEDRLNFSLVEVPVSTSVELLEEGPYDFTYFGLDDVVQS
jgi:hypothetical protein